MSKRHPHLKGNHEEGHGHGPEAIHPMHRPGAHHAFGGHEGQNRAGAESPAHEAAESPAFEAAEHSPSPAVAEPAGPPAAPPSEPIA